MKTLRIKLMNTMYSTYLMTDSLYWVKNNIYHIILITQVLIILFINIENIGLVDDNQLADSINKLTNDSLDQNNPDQINNNSQTSDSTTKSLRKTIDNSKRITNMTDFELKMQKLMSGRMDEVLSDLKKDIANSDNAPSSSTNTPSKEDLTDTYYNEVDFKIKVDSLTSKIERELALKDSTPSGEGSSNSEIPSGKDTHANKTLSDEIKSDNKRMAEEDTLDFKSKKTKEE